MYFSNIIRYYDYENIIWFSILIYTLSLGMIGIPRPFDVVYFTQHYSIWFSIYPHLLHVDIADSKQVILFIILWNWTFLIINYKLISLKCNLVESGCCATTQHTNHNLDQFVCTFIIINYKFISLKCNLGSPVNHNSTHKSQFRSIHFNIFYHLLLSPILIRIYLSE